MIDFKDEQKQRLLEEQRRRRRYARNNALYAFALLAMLVLDITAHTLSFIDRRQLNKSQSLQREMLDARCRFQTAFYEALKNEIPVEKQRELEANYVPAQYDRCKPLNK